MTVWNEKAHEKLLRGVLIQCHRAGFKLDQDDLASFMGGDCTACAIGNKLVRLRRAVDDEETPTTSPRKRKATSERKTPTKKAKSEAVDQDLNMSVIIKAESKEHKKGKGQQ